MISVFWNARFKWWSLSWFEQDKEAIVGPFAEVAELAEDVVRDIIEDYLDSKRWCEVIGADIDDDHMTIEITISAPAHLVGKYEVDLRRVTKSTARKLP